jgi:cyclopropane fatty-acyl-phospholipid synthase-like methyltransferase
MTKQNWQKIYAAGEQLNRYPYNFIVSNYFHQLRVRGGNPPKVLDLGCGAGNHSLFCAGNGAQVLAVDFSESALSVTNRRAAQLALNDKVTTAKVDFDDFHVGDSGFDLVIDRLSVTHAPRCNAKQVYDKVYDLLNPNAVILSNLFSTGHSHKDFGRYDNELDVWVDFTDGIFEGLLSASFYNEQDVLQLFDRYQLTGLRCESDRDLISDYGCLEIWKIIAQK